MSSRRNLLGLFRKWAFKPSPVSQRRLTSLMLLETVEERLAPAALPTPTILAPTASTASVALLQQVPSSSNNNTRIDYLNPQVVADPVNPLNQVLVATQYTSNANGTSLAAVTVSTSNGGQSWGNVSTFTRLRDPGIATTTNPNLYTNSSSPSVAFGRDGTVYYVYLMHTADKSRGAVAFDKGTLNGGPAGTPTILYQWYSADQALNPAIAVDNNVQSFTDPTTGVTFTDTLANRTTGKKAVYVAWNSNSSANPGDVSSSGGVLNFNPNPIQAVVSADDGATWSNPTPVTDGGFLTSPAASRGVAPQIAISPGNAGSPGSLVFAWPRQVNGQNFAQIAYETTRPDGGSLTGFVKQAYTVTQTFTSGKLGTGTIPDAVVPASGNDLPSSKTFDLTIPAGTITDPNFSLNNLTVNLNLVAPFLDHLQVELLDPTGTVSLTLLNNRIKTDGNNNGQPGGQPFPTGISSGLPGYNAGANPLPPNGGLGVINDLTNTYTVFSDTAARRVNDPASAYPYIGAYRPEGSSAFTQQASPTALIANFLANAGFTNAGAAAINGTTWHLRVTDYRGDRLTRNSAPFTADEFLQSFGLSFSSVPDGFGTDAAFGTAAPIGVDFNNAPTAGYSPVPNVSATVGLPSTVSLAFDTSLGSFTPYGGSLYVAYTGVTLNTASPAQVTEENIRIARGRVSAGGITFGTPVKVNDDAATDNFTEGNRPQFIPAVTVDAVTGTVVATWYDTRLDANQSRAATFIATSIDGGTSWSNQTVTTAESVDGTRPFLNQPKNAYDIVTGNTYTLQPVPTNVPLGNPNGVGIRQSVIASGGKIYAYWAGNANAAGLSIQSARALTAAGPRVIGNDMGPILKASSVSGFTSTGAAFNASYNTAVGPDGARGFDGFVVTLDRPIDPTQFAGLTQAQLTAIFQVRYHNPYVPLGSADPNLPIASATVFYAADPTTTPGPASILVRLAAAQFGVGTYSYAIAPVIRDRVRSAVTTITPVGGPVAFNNTTPVVVPDGPGGAATSTVAVSLPAGQVVSKVTVRLNITMTFDGDLRIFLRSPAGTRVPLVLRRGSSGDNFTNTMFDDAATTPIGSASPPYAGTFQPESPLAAFAAESPNGTWTLELFDDAAADIATLNNWTVNITGGVVSSVVTLTGNAMDQNANGVAGEANVDAFSNPTPKGGVPFTAPYTVDTQPLIIPGPHMVSSAVVNGGSAADPSLVLSGVASAVDITFDRDLYTAATDPANPANPRKRFGPGNIVRITGPAGVIFDRATATSNPLTVTMITPRVWRVGFPGQVLSGHYTVEVDSQFSAAVTLGTNQPVNIDTNLNAGLDVIRGTASAANGVAVDSSYSASFSGAAAAINAAQGTRPTTTEFPIAVPDSFIIAQSAGHQIQVVLNVSSSTANSRSVVDLIAELVAPDGTTIRLFNNVGNAVQPQSTIWFSGTILTDVANTPIQNGFQPFSAGPYNPQFPLSDLNNKSALGTWKLRIINAGDQTPNLTSWSLSLPQVRAGTGLGEANADRVSVSFRMFNQNPTDPLTQKVWTAVGPGSENGGGNSARTNGLAVDPSDPSGNTVYLGAASGGLWKSTNFLTQDAGGPTWLPLIDNGPTYALNVVSIAVFPRNNDPQQSIIFALTGEGDTGTPGVGVLRSMDGGKTWVVLDSLNNVTAGTETAPNFGGTVAPIAAATRDRTFFGKTAFKIIVDPTAVNDTERNVIVYAAFGGNGGVYRSSDTGRHWSLVRAGDATDIVLAEGSSVIGTGNLGILYAAFRGEGAFIAQPAFSAAGMTLLTGTPPGQGSFIDGDDPMQPRIPIAAPASSPTGAKGRILLATPARTNNAVQDFNYKGWLYALVITTDNAFDGLYLTKDFGANWTRVSLAQYTPLVNGIPVAGYGTNNYTRADHDTFAAPAGSTNPLPGQGNYDVGFAIDPLNPNVVYIGGTNDTAIGPGGPGTGGFIRVDTTGVMDALAVVAYDNGSTVGGNTVQFTANTGNAVTKPAGAKSLKTGADLGPGITYGVGSLSSTNTGYLNVLHDPSNPFSAASPVFFTNISSAAGGGIRNTGTGARWSVINPEVETDVHRIITLVDPITGQTRLIVGDDQGVATAVDNGHGNLIYQLGSGAQNIPLPGQIRNGNLQTIQFYSSTAQPGQLAAEIAGAIFYGDAQDDGFPVASASILQTGGTGGKLSWSGSPGDGSWGLTDQTGSGTFYDYKWPCCGGNNNEFFQVNGVGRTLFLIQPGDNPTTGVGNWGKTGGPRFAVNPVDSQGLAISSAVTGKFFRSVDQGRNWFQVTGPGTPANYSQAIAFGSPDTGATSSNQFNNFIYAGHGGQIAVTFNGGSSWTDISAGLTGSVQQIVPDTVRGSKAAYAVTTSGVFFKADATTNAAWVNITGNIFTGTDPIFSETNPAPQSGEPATLRYLTSLAVDWRYAIPDTRAGAPSATFPVLYVGGYGGVFRSLDRGQTWEIYPKGSSYSYTDPSTGLPTSVAVPDAGYFPSVEVTQLTLSQGNIDPATGQPLQQTGGLNMLTAGTYGRGAWSIRLGTPENDPAIAAIAKYQVVKQSGPQVIGVDVTQQPTTVSNTGTVRVSFNSPVLASTFTPGQIQIRDKNGQALTITGVTPIGNSTAPANYPSIPGTPADYHNLYQVTFTAANPVATGFADVVIGPGVADYAGFGLNQDNDFTNGETTADPNNAGNPADAYHGSLFLYGAATPTGQAGNLHINMPVSTVAGAPTRVIVSDLQSSNGLPNTGYTGTISLTATINGQPVVLTAEPVVQIRSVSEVGNTVTATTVGPVAFAVGQTVRVAGVGTAGYNGDVVVTGVTATGFTYFNPTAGLAPDAAGGYVSGPEVPAAALSGTPAPVPGAALPTTYTFTAADAGSHVFTVFFPVASDPTTGQTLLSVTDISSPPTTAPNPAQAFVTVTPGTADHFVLSGLNAPVVAGANNSVTVAAVDAFGNVDTNYGGTVTFTSTDPSTSARVPTTFTFTPGATGDAGVHTFAGLILATATDLTNSFQTVTVTDNTSPFISLSGSQNVFVLPDVASKFTVSGFPNSVAGVTGSFAVKALDRFGNQATGYAGTVAFSTGADDLQASFAPATYTFVTADKGAHTFTNAATLTKAGTNRTITATDTAAPAITGTQANIVISPAATSQLLVAGFPAAATAGVAGTFAVSAADKYGNVTPGYTGTVNLTTDNPLASFTQASYKFVGADAGVHTFVNGASLNKAGGPYQIAATDSVSPTITGVQTGITVKAAAASALTVTGPATATAGVPNTVTVTAFDPFGNQATGYTGTVAFTTGKDDVQATFAPPTYQFTAGDAGAHTFANGATLTKAGTRSISATDTAKASVTGTLGGIVVSPAATGQLLVAGFPATTTAGVPGTFSVTAADKYGNVTPSYLGTVNLTTDNPLGSFGTPSYTFVAGDAGVHTFTGGATLSKAGGPFKITATDGTTASITGAQTGITVTPAAAASLTVTGFPNSVAGVAGSFAVKAFDPFGNLATGYTGTVTLSSDDPQASFAPASYKFTAGDAGAHTFANGATLRTAGTKSLTATDTVTASIVGSQANIVVSPAVTSKFVLSGLPATVAPGAASPLTITAFDTFGNQTPAYVGTVALSSSDKEAKLTPLTATFAAADGGTRTLPGAVSFRRAGSQTVTATDTATGATGTIGVSVSVPLAVGFRIDGVPASSVIGSPQPLTVTAVDVFGDPVPGYTGTVTLTSTDPAAVLPPPLTFTAADRGVKTTAVTLNTLGNSTVTLTDAANAAVASTAAFQVVPKGIVASKFVVSVSPLTAATGFNRTVTVTVTDDSGVVVTGYTGTVALTTTDLTATLPTPAKLTNGVGVFNLVLRASGGQTVTATDTANAAITGSRDVTVGPHVTPSVTLAVGSSDTDVVSVFDKSGAKITDLRPFPGAPGGTRVATGDVTGDGVDDYVIGTGPGGSTHVVVYDGTTNVPVFDYDPFEATFTGGVFVATGDVNGDGIADLAITPDQGGGPRVIVLPGGPGLRTGSSTAPMANYFGIDDVNFRGGARAAIGDVNGDGYGDLVVGAGFLGGPRVSVDDGKALTEGRVQTLFNDFFIFGGSDIQNLRNGVFVAVGDLNGDGFGDVIAGGGPLGGPRVLAVDGRSLVQNGSANPVTLANFIVRNANNDRGGVRIATKNFDGDKFDELIAGDGDGVGSTVIAFKGSTVVPGGFTNLFVNDVFGSNMSGVYVG